MLGFYPNNSHKLKNSPKDWKSALHRLEGAYSEGTLRAYRTDIRIFLAWCESSGFVALPASPETIAAFVTHEAKRCSVSTIKRRLAALGKIHRLLRLENPVNDQEVVIAVRRVLRARHSRPRQALGLTRDIRDELIRAIGDDTLTKKRDKAVIAIGYDTLCRRSELVALQVEDLMIAKGGTAQILVRRSKNDQYGKGRLAYVSAASVKLVQSWIEASEIKSGPVFRAVRGNYARLEGLHPYSVNRIIKQAATKAGLPLETIANLSGHSMRVGAAQDMMTAGLDILPIMRAGGWKTTNVVARYIENTDLLLLMNKMN